MPHGELTQRVAVAAVGIPLAVVVVYVGGWVLAALLAAVAAAAALELYGLARVKEVRPFAVAGGALAAALVLAGALAPAPLAAAGIQWILTLLFVVGAAIAAIWARGPGGRPLATVGVSVFGALFCGGTLAFGLYLRELPARLAPATAANGWTGGGWLGAALLGFPIVLTWINDSSAYFGGRRWGRRKLMPLVSPGKTVEGAIAGLFGTVLAGFLYGWLLQDLLGLPLGPLAGAIGAVLISLGAQAGDLAESLLKREAEVKDSGRILPGHGGVLDRFDALFVTIPVGYWYLAAALSGPAGGVAP